MSKVIYQGKIDGEFEGFDDEVLFKTIDGRYWLQSQYRYWYHYAYNPEVVISEENGIRILTVASSSVSVVEITDVIESRIDGDFNGWEGETEYALVNGQVWQQSAYKYKYKYKHMPHVVVYRTSGGYKMQVAGTQAKVRRVR